VFRYLSLRLIYPREVIYPFVIYSVASAELVNERGFPANVRISLRPFVFIPSPLSEPDAGLWGLVVAQEGLTAWSWCTGVGFVALR
jgi:hypothetical protein